MSREADGVRSPPTRRCTLIIEATPSREGEPIIGPTRGGGGGSKYMNGTGGLQKARIDVHTLEIE